MSSIDERGYTVEEAAVLLHRGVPTVRRWINEGRLRAVKEKGITGLRWRVFIDGPIEGELIEEDHEQVEGITVESDKLNLSAALEIIENQRASLDEKERIIENLLNEKAAMAGQLGTFAARLEALTVKQIEAPKRRWWRFWKR